MSVKNRARVGVYSGLAIALLGWFVITQVSFGKNGFDLSNASIPVEEILSGGPPKDGIPAIDKPKFLAAHDADFLKPDSRVLGVARNGIAKAYPIAILNWHEIVNDVLGDEGIAITFCPLCGTGMAFKADFDGKRHSFGVSGLLYNSDVLLYDRGSESLWSQIAQEAVSGPMLGTPLTMVATQHTSWADWQTRHPDTLVLSTETGQFRDYGRDPYAGYGQSASVYFPVKGASDRYHAKELVMGLEIGAAAKSYPFSELARSAARFTDNFAGQSITVEYSAEHKSARVLGADGQEIPTVIAFWFAWSAFNPQAEVYTAQ